MDYYFVAPLRSVLEFENFQEFHYVFLDEQAAGSEAVFLCATFRHKTDLWLWKGRPGVEPLPHPLSAEKVSAKHAEALKHLGVTTDHGTIDAAEMAAKRHILMRWENF